MQLFAIGTQFIYGLLWTGLLAVMAKNLALSRWMQVALIGVLMTLSVEPLSFVLPVVMAGSGGTGAIYRLVMLREGLDSAALGVFVVGISATLFDVRRRLQVLTTMLDNSPRVNRNR